MPCITPEGVVLFGHSELSLDANLIAVRARINLSLSVFASIFSLVKSEGESVMNRRGFALMYCNLIGSSLGSSVLLNWF